MKSTVKSTPKLNIKQLGEAWQQVNWKACQRHVDRLQQSISVAMEYENWKKVKKLRRVLYKSEAYNLICTRKVTQDNQGKRTAGVDKVKLLTPAQRYDLVSNMKDGIERHWKPVRQVEIAKKNGKIRTLGIPTIEDRVYQAKLKGIIEPCYETIAETNSYGFRPMRSTKDAIESIFNSIKRKKDAWILKGDLKGFFDNIKTSAIISNPAIAGDKQIASTINNLVKSGAMTVNQELIETEKGTPQGGVISPLLANIAFNGMETMIQQWAWDNRKRTGQNNSNRHVIQVTVYADDFVVVAKDRWIVEELKEIISEWCMRKMGVELSKEKTHITNVYDGFDFLGCNIRKYEINDTKSKTLIKPSKESIKSVKAKIKDVIKSGGGLTQDGMIGKLNPILRGWANYHNGNVSKDIFSSIDNYVYEKLHSWARNRHHNKGNAWVLDKYWHVVGNRNWVFKTDNNELYKMSSTKIIRHTKIKGRHHIFDGQTEYWNKRKVMNNRGRRTRKESCLAKQEFKCNWCKQDFKHDSILELDHIVPKSCGGGEQSTNLQVLHRHCHDIKTRSDESSEKKVQRKIDVKNSDWFGGCNVE